MEGYNSLLFPFPALFYAEEMVTKVRQESKKSTNTDVAEA